MVASDVRKIQRVPMTHTDDVAAQLRAEVLEKAHKVFGYTADTFGARGPLAKALSDLGVAPLHSDQVEQYKKSKEKRWVSSNRLKNNLIGVGVWLGIEAVAYGLIRFFGGGSEVKYSVLGVIAAAYAVFGIPCINMGEFIDKMAHRRLWRTFTLGSKDRYADPYPRYIPVHLLNVALQVKAQIPDCEFTVEELTHESEQVPRPLPDPFLWARYAGERYCIGVWDEREFEAKA